MPRPVLLGRAGDLAEVDGALARAVGGTASLLVFTGPIGIGRTALLEECARRGAARRGRAFSRVDRVSGDSLRSTEWGKRCEHFSKDQLAIARRRSVHAQRKSHYRTTTAHRKIYLCKRISHALAHHSIRCGAGSGACTAPLQMCSEQSSCGSSSPFAPPEPHN